MTNSLLSISEATNRLKKTDMIIVKLEEANETLAEGLKKDRPRLCQVIGAALGGAVIRIVHITGSTTYHIMVDSRPAPKKRVRKKITKK